MVVNKNGFPHQTFLDPHNTMTVTATSTVQVNRPAPHEPSMTWDQLGAREVSDRWTEYLMLPDLVAPPEDFARRRNVWLLLTTAAFLSPSFWIYVMIAMPVMAWAAHRDSNPTALYLFLYFVIPPVFIAIPTVLINQLFALSNERLSQFQR